MARNPFDSGLGLFGGETFADVGRAMRQEDELAGLRAQKQAPDYFSGIIAKANEQMGRNIARQAGGIGSRLLRETPMEGFIQEDPRLAKVRKRDMDRQQMMQMFSTAQSDGDITIKEKDAIVDEMLKRGYPGEAKKFHDIWYDRYGNETARQKALRSTADRKPGGYYMDAEGDLIKGAIITVDGVPKIYNRNGTLSDLPEGAQKVPAGVVSKAVASDKEFQDLQFDLQNNVNSLNKLVRFAKNVEAGGQGFELLANQFIGSVKAALGKNLSPGQLATKFQNADKNALVGQLRLETVGGGVMTEKDAERIITLMGGDLSLTRSPQVVAGLLEKLYKEKLSTTNIDLLNYNFQRQTAPGRAKRFPKIKLQKIDTSVFDRLKQGKKPPASSTSSSLQKPPPSSKTVTTPSGKTVKLRVM